MSKSPNIFLPAIGVTGIVLGAAYGISTRGYKANEAEIAQRAALAAEARAEASAQEAASLQERVAAIQAEAEEALRLAAASGGTAEPAPLRETGFGLGRAAHPAELAAWDVDVLPDGRGLPEGSGNAYDGEEIFADKCAACHGDFAEGVDNWPVLAGGFDTLADRDPVKTVGSYWPYLSTVWDYVNRSMPFGEAQTLTADETYAIVAYILYSNDIIDDEFELSRETFLEVEMYNTDGFVVDDRPALEYAAWRAEPCMSDCKEGAEITRRASMVNVTPVDEFMHPVMHGEAMVASSAGEARPQGREEPAPEGAAEVAAEVASIEGSGAADPALIAAGEKVFKKCAACHQVGDGAKNRSGPQLNGVVGRAAGGVDGFKYSNAMADSGVTWDDETLAGFLAAPKTYLKGTKMSFRGLRKEEDLAAVIAYLSSFSE